MSVIDDCWTITYYLIPPHSVKVKQNNTSIEALVSARLSNYCVRMSRSIVSNHMPVYISKKRVNLCTMYILKSDHAPVVRRQVIGHAHQMALIKLVKFSLQLFHGHLESEINVQHDESRIGKEFMVERSQ